MAMRSTASVATLLGSLLLVPAPADAHLSLTPGRFEGGAAAKAQAQMAPAPPPSCQMQFSLGGDKFDVSSLSVDVGGWIAENTVDEFHYCINVCAVVTSERNCICYPCGGSSYPASQVFKDPEKGETCEAYLGELAESKWARTPRGLVLTYGGGEAQKSTQLELLCAPGVSGLDTGPTFMGKKGGVFRFSWKTSAGCPLNATRAGGGAAARAAMGFLSAQLLRGGARGQQARGTVVLHKIEAGVCGEATIDEKYTTYAEQYAGLEVGTCAEEGYAVKKGEQTITVPVVGQITIKEYTKGGDAPAVDCFEQFKDQKKCDANAACTWCDSAAVPASCNTLEDAKSLPPAVFECDPK
jgi:hypothetical protein